MSSGTAFLEEVYSALDLTSGSLLAPAVEPNADTLSRWQAVGDWLTLADRMNADRIFFVGDDPVLVFSAMPDEFDERQLIQAYRQAWSLSRPQCLFIATTDELRVYDLSTPPPATTEEWRRLTPLQTLSRTAEVAESLQAFNRSSVESGQIFVSDAGIQAERRADRQLVADIAAIARRLHDVNLTPEVAHSLIERVILLRYLEDREIITRDYLTDIARAYDSVGPAVYAEDDYLIGGADSYFVRCLRNKDLTYSIFARLAVEFNGDLFVVNSEEEAQVTSEHLNLIFRLLTGDADEGQPKLFLWAYDFSVVPISLISSMYEHFYHATQEADPKGTHYTPPELAEYVLAEALTEKVLDSNPRICDPACGSGTFLVEAYRMIVRHETARQRRQPTSAQLKQLLMDRIAGADLNGEAVRLTAFSLYLAFLNYQTPQDIRSSGPLPSLIQRGSVRGRGPLAVSDFFSPTITERAEGLFDLGSTVVGGLPWESHSFDVVIGNPPWTEPKAGPKSLSERWADERGLSVGDRSPSQLFLWRVLDMLRPDGISAMLVASSVFHNSRSRKFRSQWLTRVDIDEVVNFTQVRYTFFSRGVAPFFLVLFRLHNFERDVVPLAYLTVRPSRPLNATRAMAYGRVDRKLVMQDSLRERDYLWKVYAWGSHYDEALMSRLDQEQTLGDVLPNHGKIGGYGYQFGSDTPRGALAQLPSLRTFEPWGPIDRDWLESTPTGAKRQPSETLYLGRRLLIKRGIKVGFGPYVRLEDLPLSFRHTIYSIPLGELEDWKAKLFYGILLSSLGRYRLFMSSGSWAVWHDNILSSDIAQLPVRMGDEPDDNALQVSDLVDRIMVWRPEQSGHSRKNEEPAELLRLLDAVIYRIFGLSQGEISLVEDWRRFTLKFDSVGTSQFRASSQWLSSYDLGARAGLDGLPDPLDHYVQIFMEKWNVELEGVGELTWDIIIGENSAPIAVVFRAVENPTPLISQPESGDTDVGFANWLSTLGRLGRAMPSDLGRVLSTNGIIRVVGTDYFIVVKRNERRFWSASAAYEDFDATLLSVMRSAQ